ncbi:uncharacterized protein LOC124537891 [Vanessa cardui]|uniref:uncharacterized protein LOC124537891 n=1 Tax=Vanessa cardui TaxID=171605 RepID=UPI001F145F1B|nr:uncharacterized protein LOC124537891 [Vanessa cardui]
MRGMNRLIKVLASNRYELKFLSGDRSKTTQAAAAQYMVPWKGEWCPESCASFFSHDDDDVGEQDNSTPGTSQGLSMPQLDCEDVDMPQDNSEGCSSNVVEDDSTSGEAV